MSRASGILLHPTSLPGRFGIGDLGPEARRFADFLAGTGQHLWQMLPLGPTDYDNSPYQCLSVFAGNPLLISPERLAQENLLDPVELERIPAFPVQSVDYNAVADWKMPLLRRSFEIFTQRATSAIRDEFQEFCQKNSSWLEDYALFMALREAHRLAVWNTWEDDVRKHHTDALGLWRSKLAHIVDCHKYQQFQFFKQWAELKQFCNERGIKLIGDIPIFVALDST
ncbi:MAG: 4-alpha-glucanotransferase, partial [Chloroflexi bacterium]|nr:4-alpha-glucanotransferase [Chloroflexota bacterium]